MSKDDVTTPESPEVNNETPEESTTEESKEETLDSLNDDTQENKIPDSIPYSRFKEKVDESAELKNRLEDLEQKLAERDSTKEEVAEDIAELAKEHNLSPDALEKLSKQIEARALEQVEQKLAPLNQQQRQSQIDAKFEQMWSTVLENNPQFADVADKETVKQLALNPANKDLTLSKLVERTYGRITQSPERKTMETTQPGKTEAIDKVDFDRTQRDPEYMKAVKADPTAFADYKKGLVEQLKRRL